jgi:Tfp pilus assembly protein PilO
MENTNLQKTGNSYYLLSFLLLLVALTGFFFYVKPLWDEVGSLALGRDDLMTQKTQMQDRLTSLQQVQQQLNTGSEIARETSLTAIPEHFEEDKLLMDIVKLSRDSDVSMGGVSFGIPGETASGEVVTATISLNLTGTQGALMGFLKGIEANPRKIVVKSITVQKATAVSGVQLTNFNLSMETYYQGLI